MKNEDDSSLVQITSGTPESFGWQRRPDLDTRSGIAYENPAGEFMLFQRDQEPKIVRRRR